MMDILQQGILTELKQPGIEGPVRRLYENYFEGIVAQVCMNGGNREDGADIFQESVLVLIDKVKTGQFRGDSSIKTFLSAIARNLWLHELRTRNRRNAREAIYMKEANKNEESVDSFFDTQNTGALLQVLEEVGHPCKKILTGFYYEEKSMKELLMQFDYENEQVLRNRKSKCMKKLKDLLTSNTALLRNLKTLLLYE
jgi:RNA polymerase sigma factor (sigma-70 family)